MDKPFFWLGDTGWLLLRNVKKEEAIQYLDDRKAKGFNVIQVMLLHELNITDAYGDSALMNKNIAAPDLAGKYNYWDNVDFVIDESCKSVVFTWHWFRYGVVILNMCRWSRQKLMLHF